MRIAVFLVILAIFTCPSLSATPATAPATTTSPVRTEDMTPIYDGTIRYLPPPGWELVGKTPDGKSVTYKHSFPDAAMILTVTPEDQAMKPEQKERMAMIIGKAIRENAAKEKRELVLPPRVEPDDRYYLKLHDIIRVEDKVSDRIQMYRVVGLNLVHVACTVIVESPEQSQETHAAAESLLDTMRLARGAKRSVYPHSGIKGIVPLDWKEQKTDTANGQMAVYTNPKTPAQQIYIRTRVLPKDARDAGPKRDAILERMIDDDRRQPPMNSATAKVTDEQTVASDKFLKQLKATVAQGGDTLHVQTRYVVVADVLVSVRSVSSEADTEATNAIADQVAQDLKPIRD